MADRKPCRAHGCDNTIAQDVQANFCFSCSTELAYQGRELEKDLDHFLQLEAEFSQYCKEHGLPDPHAD